MNLEDKRELFELTQAFNQEPTFTFARHIWVKCHKLGVEAPPNVMEVFFNRLAEDDKAWGPPPPVKKIIKTIQKLNRDMNLFDFVEEYKMKNNSSTEAALDAYVAEFQENERSEKYGKSVTFEGLKKQLERLEQNMQAAVEKYKEKK